MAAKIDLVPEQRRALARAKALAIAADLLWLAQAASIAILIAGWLDGGVAQPVLWVTLFVSAGSLRAILSARAGRIAFDLGQQVVSLTRRRLLDREAPRPNSTLSSAEVAAMVTDKIPLLAPDISRYRIAFARVKVVPIVLLLVVLSQSWAAAAILLVTGPLIPVFMALVGMAARDASAKQMAEIGAVNRVLVDHIAALPDIRLLGGFDRSRRAFAVHVDSLRERTMAVLRIAFLSSTVLELFAAIGMAMVAVYVGFTLLGEINFGTWRGTMTPATGIFILLLVPEFFQPLRDLAAAWHDKATADAVRDDLENAAGDETAAILGAGGRVTPLDGPVMIRVREAQVLRGARHIVLPDIDLGPGQSLALTGPSGAGKSTALDALAGLLPLSSGHISVQGVPLDDAHADAWRARIAMVPQRLHMPDAALHDILDPHGTGANLADALSRADATDVVAALPDGLDTRLGETGAGVSGGEARRLLLARALFSGADIIIADEPTADLDTDTAARIIAALRRAQSAGATVIVASHDPNLIAAMDRVVSLSGPES